MKMTTNNINNNMENNGTTTSANNNDNNNTDTDLLLLAKEEMEMGENGTATAAANNNNTTNNSDDHRLLLLLAKEEMEKEAETSAISMTDTTTAAAQQSAVVQDEDESATDSAEQPPTAQPLPPKPTVLNVESSWAAIDPTSTTALNEAEVGINQQQQLPPVLIDESTAAEAAADNGDGDGETTETIETGGAGAAETTQPASVAAQQQATITAAPPSPSSSALFQQILRRRSSTGSRVSFHGDNNYNDYCTNNNNSDHITDLHQQQLRRNSSGGADASGTGNNGTPVVNYHYNEDNVLSGTPGAQQSTHTNTSRSSNLHQDSLAYLNYQDIESSDSDEHLARRRRSNEDGVNGNGDDDSSSSIESECTTKAMAKAERRAVKSWRLAACTCFVALAIFASVGIYFLARNQELNQFNESYTIQANEVLDAYQYRTHHEQMNVLNTLSQTIQSYTDTPNDFPFVSIPNAARVLTPYLELLGNAQSIALLPIVATDERSKWEAYSTLYTTNNAKLASSLSSMINFGGVIANSEQEQEEGNGSGSGGGRRSLQQQVEGVEEEPPSSLCPGGVCDDEDNSTVTIMPPTAAGMVQVATTTPTTNSTSTSTTTTAERDEEAEESSNPKQPGKPSSSPTWSPPATDATTGAESENNTTSWITPYIHDGQGNTDTSSGPYVVGWQHVPLMGTSNMVNFNFRSLPDFDKTIADPVILQQNAAMSKAFMMMSNNGNNSNNAILSSMLMDEVENNNGQEEETGWSNRRIRSTRNLLRSSNRRNLQADEHNDEDTTTSSSSKEDDGPLSMLYYPIIVPIVTTTTTNEGNDDGSIPSTKTVALMASAVFWKSYFENILPNADAKSNGFVVVVENKYNQVFTYRLDGRTAKFFGIDDLHDTKYDSMGMVSFYSGSAGDPITNDDGGTLFWRPMFDDENVKYRITVYPSDDLQSAYLTSMPIIYSVSMVAIFIVIAIIFILYDRTVERRQRNIYEAAIKSAAVVDSLFPKTVRDRLMEETAVRSAVPRKASMDSNYSGTGIQGRKSSMGSNYSSGVQGRKSSMGSNYSGGVQGRKSSMGSNSSGGEFFGSVGMPSPSKLIQDTRRSIVGTMNTTLGAAGIITNTPQQQSQQQSNHEPEMIPPTRSLPIADFFPETTILFMDIRGFTAWCSTREPAQVFSLLETVYNAFDMVAKRRRVFKVETVGDCYMAVTGLPDPRKDHAVAMCRFARECLFLFSQLVHQLEITLGPDTADLGIRCGLNSGAVTGGVIRGENARFQLFGDTVNTAARMESTGEVHRIQLSQETADLLIAAGKERWITARDTMVHAKGKGEMQTYWLATYNPHSNVGVDGGGRGMMMDGGTERSCSDVGGADVDNNNNNDELTGHEITVQTAPSATPASATSDAEKKIVHKMATEKMARLIKWNVDLLARLLVQIVARRNTSSYNEDEENNILDPEKFAELESHICDHKLGQRTIDEVQEFITLPEQNITVDQALINTIKLPDAVLDQLHDYIHNIASMYNDNDFHSFEHASHVTMSVQKLLTRIVAPSKEDVAEDKTLHDHTYGITSDPLTQFACVLSALIHDTDHSGVPNAQLVKEKSEIAEFYYGKSVAEQNSVDLAFNMLMDDDYKDLRATIYRTETEMLRFRHLVVNSVMATDIVDKDLKQLRNKRWDRAFAEKEDTHQAVNRKATIIIEHLIQASDVAHTMQHWHIYRKWNERFFMECYKAYKRGRAENDPSENWYQSEMGFFDYYIIPLALKLKECGVFGVSSDEYLNYATNNRKEWESRGFEVVSEMKEKALKKEAEDAWAANAYVPKESEEMTIVFNS